MQQLATTTRYLKALSDETRLRILHLVGLGELSVSDLMEVLNLGQSRISTHLTLLKEVGLVKDRRAGRRSYYSLAGGPGGVVLEQVLAEQEANPELDADRAGFETLNRRRQEDAKSYFDRVAATFGEQALPGRTWEGFARGALRLLPRARYVDLGVGDGLLTLMLAEVAESVTAVDVSAEMLSQLRARATRRGIGNVETIEGPIEDLPLPGAGFEVAVLSQALHHADTPSRALCEAYRVLRPGGKVLVLDLLAHGEEWVREQLHDRHLGFTEARLEELLMEAGFEQVSVERAARDPQPPHFMTLLATGTKA